MVKGFRIRVSVCLFSALLSAPSLRAQIAPPESTSKVKRVLLFNLIGGWSCIICRDTTTKVFIHLGQSKGFGVDTTSSMSDLTRENLKRYQAIVWNNNTNGGSSVPDIRAREAVAEYVRQGGGWMFVNIANDHAGTWPFLYQLMGPGTSGWGPSNDPGVLFPDSAAERHPELQFLVDSMPDSIPLRTIWLRPLALKDGFERLIPIYRVRNTAWMRNSEYYSDQYIWASTHEKGRALAVPLGWPQGPMYRDIMAQADSAVPRLYWQGLRWLAGDYQRGCINPGMPGFDPEARVDDGSCPTTGVPAGRKQIVTPIRISGRRLHFSSPVAAGSRLRLRDVRGQAVWLASVPNPAKELALPDGLLPGLYFLEAIGSNKSVQARVLIQ